MEKKGEILDKEVDLNDSTWPKIRSKLYRLYLAYWKEVKAHYDKLGELGEHSELVNFLLKEKGDLKEEDIKLLTGRELELWKPILALAMFIDSHSPPGTKFTSSLSSLTAQVLELAVESARQRLVESMTETGEIILIQTLLGMVSKDGYYRVRDIKEAMAKHFDEEEEWLTTRWVGNALRLGFKEKRRVGTGYEYMLRVSDVKDLAERMGVLTPEQQTKPEARPEGGFKRLTDPCVGECFACDITYWLHWYVESSDGERVLLCDECVRRFRRGDWFGGEAEDV